MEDKTAFIYGNSKLLNFFEKALDNNKLAHAYIFEGGRGSGKHTLARRLSCMLACQSLFESPCMMCESCRKISENISPDVIEIALQNDKKTIGVDQIRELRSSVYIRPSEEEVKIYIISNAECMTEQAQNVFLKILEEPPRGVYFLLLCENTSNILPTVKSRAPVLRMQMFSDSEIKGYLLSHNKSAQDMKKTNEEELDLIVRISEGKIGEAERLLNDSRSDKSQSKHEKAKRLFELVSEMPSYQELLIFVQNMASARDELVDILLYAIYAARDIAAVKRSYSSNVEMIFFKDREAAERLASGLTSAGVMAVYDELCRARENVSLNTNLSNVLTNLASRLQDAANS